MLGNTVRTRVKQTATYVTATSKFTLTGGTAADGHRTFIAAYDPSSSGSINTWYSVPLLIEKANGTWQIGSGDLTINFSGQHYVENFVVSESSSTANAALSISDGEVVDVSVVPSAQAFRGMAVRGYVDAGYFDPHLGGSGQFGLMAVGPSTSATGRYATGFGENLNSGGDFSYMFGRFAYAMNSVELGLWNGSWDRNFDASVTTQSGACLLVRNAVTTDATATALEYVRLSGTGNADLYCDAGLVYWKAIVIGTTAAGVRKVWEYSWMTWTDYDYNPTEILGTPVKTELHEDAGATSWDIAVELVGVGASNEVQLKVTGAAATVINWTARIDTTHHNIYNNI